MPDDAEILTEKCNKLEIQQKLPSGFLGGPFECSFNYDGINITIKQYGLRTIYIESHNLTNADQLYSIFIALDKLLWLFNGEFIPISKMIFYIDNEETEKLNQCKVFCMSHRLACFSSADFCKGNFNNLSSDFNQINAVLFQQWNKLLDKLDIIHTSILYHSSNSDYPVDLRIANIIEAFEPLSELIPDYDVFFPDLKDSNKNLSLRMCLDAAISKYGKDIFDKEYSINKQKFLSYLVNSRVRIMHTKPNYPKFYFNGNENLLYCVKLLFLYRSILMTFLGIDYELYSKKLKESIKKWDDWQGINELFIRKLSSR